MTLPASASVSPGMGNPIVPTTGSVSSLPWWSGKALRYTFNVATTGNLGYHSTTPAKYRALLSSDNRIDSFPAGI